MEVREFRVSVEEDRMHEVSAGDLITADDWNALIRAVKSLQSDVRELQTRSTAGAPARLEGDVSLQWLKLVAAPANAQGPYVFQYQIVSHANRRAEFTIDPSINIPGCVLRVLDADTHSDLPNARMTLDPEQTPRNFYVSVNDVHNVGAGTSVTLKVEVTAEGQTVGVSRKTFQVGTTPKASDPTIEVSQPKVTPASAWDEDNHRITLSPGQSATIEYDVYVKSVTDYVPVPVPDPAGPVESWSVTTPERVPGSELKGDNFVAGRGFKQHVSYTVTAPVTQAGVEAARETPLALSAGYMQAGSQLETADQITVAVAM